MIANVVFIVGWAVFLGSLAQHAARRRGLCLRAAPAYWMATACTAALAAATSYATLSIDATLVVLAVAAVVDAQSGFIFDPLVIAGIIGILVVSVLEGTGGSSFYGGTVAGAAVFCMWALTLGRGIGLGDVKLAAVVGAGFGPIAGIYAIGLSFIVGAAIAIAQIIAGKARFGTSIRFGPYLLAGSVCLLAYHRLSDGVLR
jgi:prepilin signal peptidase PulO-like enzyme (type II secretory pathway)